MQMDTGTVDTTWKEKTSKIYQINFIKNILVRVTSAWARSIDKNVSDIQKLHLWPRFNNKFIHDNFPDPRLRLLSQQAKST